MWKFQDRDVKIRVDGNGKEWFCGRDVCKILGFKDIKVTLLRQVKQAYKCSLKSLKLDGELPPAYHEGKAVYISEPGLYQLIFSSRLETADAFRTWVFEEVLPGLGYLIHTFTTPSAEIPSTSSAQSQELKRQKIQSLYRHLGVSVDPNLADLERFRLKTTGSQIIFRFMTSNGEWENLTNKRTGKWLADNTLKKILGGHSGMVRHLGLEDIPERFKRQKDAARRLNKSLPTDLEMESIPLDDLGRRVSDVDSELRKSFAELPMRDLLGLDKALQRIQGELANNIAKLSQVDHHIAHENEKLKTMDSSYTEEQREEVTKTPQQTSR